MGFSLDELFLEIDNNIDLESKCINEKRTCLYVVIDLKEFEKQVGNVYLDSDRKKSRPIVTFGDHEDAKKFVILSSKFKPKFPNRRKFNLKECIKGDCKRYLFTDKSYLFNERNKDKVMVRDVPVRLLKDRNIVIFCGTCETLLEFDK